MTNPWCLHLVAVHGLFVNLLGLLSVGYSFLLDHLFITAYSNANWAGCPDTCRSTTRWCMYLGNALVPWKSKKQKQVSRSSIEEKYWVMLSSHSEILWLRKVLSELGFLQNNLTPLYANNTSAIRITTNPIFHERTKHIKVDCHSIREAYDDHTITFPYVSMDLHISYIFTKALTKNHHQFFIDKLLPVDSRHQCEKREGWGGGY